MSESIKWSETNVGKYSMFDVELGEIKTTVSCDSENSEKLISLLNELEHTHTNQSEELEILRKQIKNSVLLSEAEKSTLVLMRKQIDGLLNSSKEILTADDLINQKGGMKELHRLCKEGVQQQEVAKQWGLSPARISIYIHKHGKSWKELKE